MLLGLPLLSLAIWVPIAAGLAVLAAGSDRNAQTARGLALLGAVLGFAGLVVNRLHNPVDDELSGSDPAGMLISLAACISACNFTGQRLDFAGRERSENEE
jgi:hypothetical protein